VNPTLSQIKQEASDGVIELKGDDARVVDAMFRYMYTFEYDSSSTELSPTLFNVRVYSIADKYDVSALKLEAKEKIESYVTKCWYMDDFPHVISEIYSSTPPEDRDLRDIVLGVAEKHIDDLLEKESFCTVFDETVGFAADIALLLAKQKQSQPDLKKYRCPDCGRDWHAVLSQRTEYHCLQCGRRRTDWEKHVRN
jgi:hypothetical protein